MTQPTQTQRKRGKEGGREGEREREGGREREREGPTGQKINASDSYIHAHVQLSQRNPIGQIGSPTAHYTTVHLQPRYQVTIATNTPHIHGQRVKCTHANMALYTCYMIVCKPPYHVVRL